MQTTASANTTARLLRESARHVRFSGHATPRLVDKKPPASLFWNAVAVFLRPLNSTWGWICQPPLPDEFDNDHVMPCKQFVDLRDAFHKLLLDEFFLKPEFLNFLILC